MLDAHSVEGVRGALNGLVAQGVVIGTPVGRAVQYELNRAHLAALHIVALARLRDDLLDAASELIGAWSIPVVAVVLFGSAARGDMAVGSDIDIAVVRPAETDVDDPTWRNQVDHLEATVTGWTGNDTRTLEYGESEVRSTPRDPVLGVIAAEGIRLAGTWPRPESGAA
ncbi:hypothetical protein BH24ACT4_BH24ACT4_19060 [soil metagenome]